jgi:hypothetical protein
MMEDEEHNYMSDDQQRRTQRRGVQPHTQAAGSPPPKQRRKPLREMSHQELAEWLEASRVGLADFSTKTVQPYLDYRARSGRHTPTDTVYSQFQELAADLIAGLGELREAAEDAAQQQQK